MSPLTSKMKSKPFKVGVGIALGVALTAGASAAALAADQYNQEGLQSQWDGIYAVASADYQSGCDLLPSLYKQVNDSHSLPVASAYVDATQGSIYSLVDAMRGVESDLVGTSCLAQSEPTVVGEQAPVAVAAGATAVSPDEQRLSSAKVGDGAAASAALSEALTAASKSHTVLAAQVTQVQWHGAKAGYSSASRSLAESVESAQELAEVSVADVALREILASLLDEAQLLADEVRPEATDSIVAATANLQEVQLSLDNAATKVEESRQAWQAEQERIAAEKAREADTGRVRDHNDGCRCSGGINPGLNQNLSRPDVTATSPDNETPWLPTHHRSAPGSGTPGRKTEALPTDPR